MRWGFVGLGKHADEKMAPALSRTEGNSLVAVASRSAERAADFARRHDAAAAFDDYALVTSHPDVDAVYVSTKHNEHAECVLAAARSGKHVLCEKPLTLTVDEAEEVVAACAEEGVTLGLCLQNRHHPAHLAVRAAIAAGELGTVRLVSSRSSLTGAQLDPWRSNVSTSGGGISMGPGLHALDLPLFITGQSVVDVSAYLEPANSDDPDQHVAVLLRLSGTTLASVMSSGDVSDPQNDLVVEGSRGVIVCRGTIGMSLSGSLRSYGCAVADEKYTVSEPEIELYIAMIDDFVDAVDTSRDPLASGDDGLTLVRLADAVRRAVA